MTKPKTTDETGPIYGVPLIDTLPLGNGSMLQQMPDRFELDVTRKMSERTVAGYEVLLGHYLNQCDEVERLKGLIRDVIQGDWSITGLQEAIGDL